MNIKFKEFVAGVKYLKDESGSCTKSYVDAADTVNLWLKDNPVEIIDWKAVITANDDTIIIIQYCELDN